MKLATTLDELKTAIDNGTFGDMFEQAMANDQARLQAQFEHAQAVRASAVAAVEAQTIPNRAVIRLDGVASFRAHARGRRERRLVHMFVSGVSYADGDGYRIKKIWYTDNRQSAMVFSGGVGFAIAKQLASNFRAVNTTMEQA